MIFKALNKTLIRTKQSMRLMVGVPDYEMYVNHMKTAHPEQAVMSYPEFFRERQEARYGAKGRLNRCC